MSEHYHDVGDMRFLKEMSKLAPTEFKAWLGLDDIVRREDGAIPRKYRELIALGVAFTTQCPYCIEGHVKGAKAVGATREDLIFLVGVYPLMMFCGRVAGGGSPISRSMNR